MGGYPCLVPGGEIPDCEIPGCETLEVCVLNTCGLYINAWADAPGLREDMEVPVSLLFMPLVVELLVLPIMVLCWEGTIRSWEGCFFLRVFFWLLSGAGQA